MVELAASLILIFSLVSCVVQANKFLAEKRRLAGDRRRIETYLYQMEMNQLNRLDQLKLRGLVDASGGLSRARATQIYSARSSKDEGWADKQLVTLMLVRMDRLAAAYYLGIFDEELFFLTTGRHFISTLRRMRFYIAAVQEDRPAAFATFILVARHMSAVSEAADAHVEVEPLHRIAGTTGINQ